ncbi:MAG: RNA pseudouridine synthase, partial [Bacilli bacterium]
IIHRLDKDTSGIIMFAKSEQIKYMYQNNWDNLVTERNYVAIVEGVLESKEGTIKSYLKETKTLLVYSTDDEKNGKLAITKYKVIKTLKNYSMLNIEIKTGRKNQIRVHMKDIGHIVIGDKKYGSKTSPINRLALHANRLIVTNPKTKKSMVFETNIPKSFKTMFNI